MSQVEVEIFGGGIFGLAVAWSCIRLGASVRVIEKRRIGSGASGGPVGALAPHVPDNWNPKKQFQFESLFLADSWWTAVAEAAELDPGYARIGRLQPLPAGERSLALAMERHRSAAINWQNKAHWSVVDASGSWSTRPKYGKFVHDTLSARINPARALRCLELALSRHGCEILEGETESQGSRCRVRTTGFEGLLELSESAGRTVGGGEKGQALLLDYDAGDAPQIFGDGIHVVPHSDRTTAVGSTSEREFDDPTATDGKLNQLHAAAVRMVPELEDADVIARWAGVRPRATTRAPLLGPHPFRRGEFIANGGYKIGLGIAPLVGNVMAELVLEGRSRIPGEFLPETLFNGQNIPVRSIA